MTAADGAPVTVHTRCGDLTRLTAADLADGSLVTASALLDMLTAEEIERVVAACAGAARPVRRISVTGRVGFTPADPLDAAVDAAFNDHQRRTVDGRRLLGPDAVAATVAAFARRGVDVRERPSPWRLGPDQADLTAEWFRGLARAPPASSAPSWPARPQAYARPSAGRRGGRPTHRAGRTH